MTTENRIAQYNKNLANVINLYRQLQSIKKELEAETKKEGLWKEKLGNITKDFQTLQPKVRATAGYIADLRHEKLISPNANTIQKLYCAYEAYYDANTELGVIKSAQHDIERELVSISQRIKNLTAFHEVTESEIIKEVENLKIELIMIEKQTGLNHYSTKIDNMVKMTENNTLEFVGNINDLELISVSSTENNEK